MDHQKHPWRIYICVCPEYNMKRSYKETIVRNSLSLRYLELSQHCTEIQNFLWKILVAKFREGIFIFHTFVARAKDSWSKWMPSKVLGVLALARKFVQKSIGTPLDCWNWGKFGAPYRCVVGLTMDRKSKLCPISVLTQFVF